MRSYRSAHTPLQEPCLCHRTRADILVVPQPYRLRCQLAVQLTIQTDSGVWHRRVGCKSRHRKTVVVCEVHQTRIPIITGSAVRYGWLPRVGLWMWDSTRDISWVEQTVGSPRPDWARGEAWRPSVGSKKSHLPWLVTIARSVRKDAKPSVKWCFWRCDVGFSGAHDGFRNGWFNLKLCLINQFWGFNKSVFRV